MGTNTHTPNPWPSVGGLTLDTSDQVAKEQNWQEWRDGQHGYMCYVERISTSPGLPTQVSVRSLDPYPAYPAGYIFSFPPSDPALLPELARTQNYPHLQLSLTVDDGDQTNVKLENAIANWTAERDTLAAQIKSLLDAAEFNGQPIDQTQANGLIRAGEALLERAASCTEEPDDCGE